jgi:hypothetical protein
LTLDPEKARHLMGAMASAQGEDNVLAATEDVLNFLLRQLEELRELANGYPRNPIDGAVWSNGKDLAEICDELTELFSRKGLLREEELASRLATGMACQVMGHYPEEIFPRVLRNSRCRETIADLEEAIGGYEAIVGDFHAMGLSELLEDDQPLDQSERAILESVYEAARRLGELRPERNGELEDLQLTLKRRLAQQSEG